MRIITKFATILLAAVPVAAAAENVIVPDTVGADCSTDGASAHSNSLGQVVACTNGVWALAPNASSLTLSSPMSPAPANMLTVTIAGTQSFAIDAYGNTRFANYVDYAGFDSNLSVYALSTTGNALYLTSDGAGGTNDNVILYPNGTGKVGVGTTTPQAKLDVNGFARLALNSTAPAACNQSIQGSIALTHNAQVCVCDTTPAWHVLNTATACSW